MSAGMNREWTGTDTRRAVSFAMSVMVALASGSNYGYSAYAPQLAARLHLSSTHINLVGTGGNLGMYLTGPLWGKIVDSRGHRIPLLIGSIIVFLGYITVHAFYTLTIPIRSDPADPPAPMRLFILAFAMFLTGSGGSAAISAAINSTAKSFSDSTRASMTGTVLAGLGLSAFAFSTIGHLLYGGDAGGLLLLLAFGTGIPMFIGAFLVTPVPPNSTEGYERLETEGVEEIADEEAYPGIESDALARTRSTSLELTRSSSPGVTRGRAHHRHFSDDADHSLSPAAKRIATLSPPAPAYTPAQLLHLVDFWLLFSVLALLCGAGLMYINNAGTVALALARDGQLEYDPKVIGAWQAKQVATFSIWNCAGRILGGIFTDFCKTRYNMQRIWFLPAVAFTFIISQLEGLNTTDVSHLWLTSTILGVSYGSLFNVLPMLVLEWFGMTHFSQNYGWTCVAPVIGGNIFNLVFGRVYDSNALGRVSAPEATSAAAELVRDWLERAGGGDAHEPGKHDCLLGSGCYATAFRVSTFGCVLALVLSVVAGMRRQRLSQDAKRVRS